MTPEIDAAELYYDGPTGFVPIEDARKVERKLNDALKENARLRPALMGFSQAEELMELREDLRKEQRCSLDLARQNNILQDYNKKLGRIPPLLLGCLMDRVCDGKPPTLRARVFKALANLRRRIAR